METKMTGTNDTRPQGSRSLAGAHSALPLKKLLSHGCVAVLASCLLMACSGGDSKSKSAADRNAQTTVAPTAPDSGTPDDTEIPDLDDDSDDAIDAIGGEIGRASCRERV